MIIDTGILINNGHQYNLAYDWQISRIVERFGKWYLVNKIKMNFYRFHVNSCIQTCFFTSYYLKRCNW